MPHNDGSVRPVDHGQATIAKLWSRAAVASDRMRSARIETGDAGNRPRCRVAASAAMAEASRTMVEVFWALAEAYSEFKNTGRTESDTVARSH